MDAHDLKCIRLAVAAQESTQCQLDQAFLDLKQAVAMATPHGASAADIAEGADLSIDEVVDFLETVSRQSCFS